MPDFSDLLSDNDRSIATLLPVAYHLLANASETAELDAEVLLCHCLSKNRSFLRAWPEFRLNTDQFRMFSTLIAQRKHGLPIAYLIGEREFWSRSFKIDSNVLIPRPDTELLIELGLNLLPANRPCKLLDLGTGSGIIAITLAAERPFAEAWATDLSQKALDIAIENAKRLQINNLHFVQSNWFDAINQQHFDLIVSNPPYIAEDDPHLQQGDIRFEPKTALISAEQGLADIKIIAEQSRRYLTQGGWLLVEHGYDQQASVQAIFNELDYRQVHTHSDLSGNPRVTSGLWCHHAN